MMLLAAVLTLGIHPAVDLRPLLESPKVTCGIKVVGYHIAGEPGQRFRYAGDDFEIPSKGFVEVIALPRVKHYTVNGKKRPLEDRVSALDAFSFRWITLPAPPEMGGRP